MEKAHAKLAPSASKRWISCPGSVQLSENIPETTSVYAEEGSEAHEYAAKWLIEGVKPAGMNPEMAEAVEVYVNYVNGLCSSKEIDEGLKTRYIEERFSLEWLHPDMFGTSDFSLYDRKTKKLTIVDYKHGKGVAVDAEWNTQLMMYALGIVHTIWSDNAGMYSNPSSLFGEVELVIVQPRAFHAEGEIRSWSLTAKELMFWALQILRPSAKATTEKDAMLRTGDHCKFCPALAMCPEQAARATAVAKTDFNVTGLPRPEDMTPADIVKVLKASSVISEWAAQVALYAKDQMAAGAKLPGYKLVRGRSNRKWVDEKRAEATLIALIGSEAYTTKVKSIAQAEKILKKAGMSPEAALAGLWEKPEGNLTLAPETDNRPEATNTAEIDFVDNAEFLK